MTRPWTPEIEVSVERAQELLRCSFPELGEHAIAPLASGWDNTGYLVDDTWVFRFPRREIAVDLMRAECAVLPALVPHLPLAIPDPVHQSGPVSDYPWPFAGYRLLPGTPASDAGLDDEARARTAIPLARFLRALHDFPAERARAAGAPGDLFRRLDPERSVPQVEELFDKLGALGLAAPFDRLRPIVEALPTDHPLDTTTLAHGDLDGRHVLVDDRARPCGVIDWGDLHVGDAAVDLALACGFLPPAAQEAFRDAYGPIDDAQWRTARFAALHKALNVLVYAHDAGLPHFFAEARGTLARLADAEE
ncbi:MAG: phosphotransferase [bacterium]|nr:phosphotransferase [bacterium]